MPLTEQSSRWGRWIGSLLYIVVDVSDPKPSKNQTRECHCGHFAASFAPRTPTASPFLPKNIFRKSNIFTKHFSQKPFPYAFPAHLPRWKLTANGFSSYELFTKKCDFHAFLQCEVPVSMKTHFLILSRLRSLYEGFCVFAGETSCCSYFTNMTF